MLLCVYCVCVHAQSWPTLCNYMDRSPRDSSVHGIFQARILKWFPFPSSSGSSQPKDRTLISCISCIGRWILYHGATWGSPFSAPNFSQFSLLNWQYTKPIPNTCSSLYNSLFSRLLLPFVCRGINWGWLCYGAYPQPYSYISLEPHPTQKLLGPHFPLGFRVLNIVKSEGPDFAYHDIKCFAHSKLLKVQSHVVCFCAEWWHVSSPGKTCSMTTGSFSLGEDVWAWASLVVQ